MANIIDQMMQDAGSEQPSAPAPSIIDQMKTDASSAVPVATQSDPSLWRRAINVVGAGMAGVNHGVVADLAGIPVDAAANAMDLGKAVIGYGTSKITGQAPPDWTAPSDRSQVPGTSQWIENKINRGSTAVGIASPIQNLAPADPIASGAFTIGRGVGSSVVPGATLSRLQMAKNLVMGGASSSAAAAAASIAPDSPEWQILASMTPQMAAKGAITASNFAITGGEQGRVNMAQRMQDLKNGGIASPSLGLATGNPLVMGVENLLSKVPGSVGAFQDANKANFAGMQDKVQGLRDSASPTFGANAAGTALQSDITAFPRGIKSTFNGLLDNATNIVGGETKIPVNNSIATALQLSTPNAGAPNTSALLVQPSISKLAASLVRDNLGAPPYDPVLAAGGNAPTTPGIPFNTVRAVRTDIGNKSESNSILKSPEQRQLQSLYGALSQDLVQGANQSDRQVAGVPIGPLLPSDTPATNAWNRSNDYYSSGMDRFAKIEPFANKSSPEQVYSALVNAANGNVSTLQAVKKSVSPDTRARIAATLIDGMGTARPGSQDSTGSVFSPETYLTNFNKMAPQGRAELLSGFPGSEGVNTGANDVAKAASLLRDGSKIWANPSGTGGNVMAGSALGSILGNVFTNPSVALGGVAGLVGANQVTKRLLLNPKFVEAMAKANNPQDPAAKAAAQLEVQNMILNAKLADQLMSQ